DLQDVLWLLQARLHRITLIPRATLGRRSVLALYDIDFASSNDRDVIHGWLPTPAAAPKGVVQLIHGLGEHSRRYLHLISALLDAGFAVAADDHAGHGRTAMQSGIWA